MVLKIASIVLLCGCLVAAKETDSQQKRQTYLGSPQAGRYLNGDAYQLHQSRLTASLAQSEEEADSAAQAQNDEELRRDAISNARLAADSFKQSYRQSRVQPQPYAYATQEPVQQQQQQQQEQQQRQQQQEQQQRQQQQAYAPTPSAPQQQDYQPALQALYQNSPAVQRLPANSQASLQNYQAHAQLAEEAAKAFQEALQQRSSRQKRPRIQNPQYILEQQHSFTVPEQTPEQYNLAAVQQAYQQIEQQQRQAADDIRASEARPAAPTAQTSQQDYDEPNLGFNIGDGPSNYEPARQRGQKKYHQRPAAEQDVAVEIKSRRPSTVRNRPVVSQTYQAETPRVPVYQTEPVTAAPVQYESIQSQVPYEIVQQYQPQTTPEPVVPTYQPVQEVPRAPVAPARQPVRIPAPPTPTQPIFLPTPTPPVTRIATPARVAAPAPARVAAPAPARAPVAAPARIPAPVQIPQAYQAQTAPAPVQIPQAYPAQLSAPVQIAQAYPAQAAPASVRIPAAPVRIPSAPVQIPAASAQYPGLPAGLPSETIDGKLVNLDLNLLRSLYQAAEALAKKQKDDVGPITEDELIKALIEQGKREEQQATEQLKKAKAEPERPKVEVVRIPKPKQITQEELQALIAAGYDITPLDEEPTAKNADPIKQQYLRQAEFLERQAVYRSQKPNTRRARDDKAVQDEVATD